MPRNSGWEGGVCVERSSILFFLFSRCFIRVKSAALLTVAFEFRLAKQRFDEDADFKLRAREAVTKLQSGDPATLKVNSLSQGAGLTGTFTHGGCAGTRVKDAGSTLLEVHF